MAKHPYLIFKALLGQMTAKCFMHAAIVADANQRTDGVFYLMHDGRRIILSTRVGIDQRGHH